ncbi:iron-sulfur cluster biosynthesis family protein [Xylanimonas ulmi]|uniref:Fe-S cluster assembly iron-binding protein IscA n=1 Tax=Xylanimonas ulmi TaxID=228973 RepID=A0A4Q7M734_9MICO|nr:iron-sulfur cluster biosynthesis family protein [Xylanibacterium ulmi]RZS62897.1 Fe-S cluster assembly iron-binding protein IscA [Xylanibacterium ulmi]
MLTVTDNARAAVESLAQQAGIPREGGLRIAQSAGQPGNFELALVPAPQPDDQVVDEAGASNVFVERQAAPELDALSLDTDPEAQSPGFVLTYQR